MSNFHEEFALLIKENQRNAAIELGKHYFYQLPNPWVVFLDDLSYYCSIKHLYHPLIEAFVDSFREWKNQCCRFIPEELFDESFFLFTLPLEVVEPFAEIFHVPRHHLIGILRRSLSHSVHSQEYKRILNIIVKFRLQLEFHVEEILLPLILNNKDHLIYLFLDKQIEVETTLLQLLDHLYMNGGFHFRSILWQEFGIRDSNLNKKTIRKLAIRLWNSIGNRNVELYRNLATLQDRSALGYLVASHLGSTPEERTMSEDCWKEAIEDVVQENSELKYHLIELLAERSDGSMLNFWLNKFQIPIENLSPQLRHLIKQKQQVFTDTTVVTSKKAKEFYQIKTDEIKINFVDSAEGYEKLLDRLFNRNRPDEPVLIGFDCEWKPIYRNVPELKQRISVMQIAFADEVFLLDLLNFYHTFDNQAIQERLATRLFDDDQMTVLCYGFRSDMSMLISSFPLFDQALKSAKTLLDLSMIHTELIQKNKNLFPFSHEKTKDKGLSEFVRLCFGRPLDKSEQCSNWESRPLRESQQLYAATDALCLLDIYHFLIESLNVPIDYLHSFRGKTTIKKNEENGEQTTEATATSESS